MLALLQIQRRLCTRWETYSTGDLASNGILLAHRQQLAGTKSHSFCNAHSSCHPRLSPCHRLLCLDGDVRYCNDVTDRCHRRVGTVGTWWHRSQVAGFFFESSRKATKRLTMFGDKWHLWGSAATRPMTLYLVSEVVITWCVLNQCRLSMWSFNGFKEAAIMSFCVWML